ncbi:MAG: response regulator, partial [Alphaproteobacteria bacterium]|nr:response regulator [Alphaproteobacteria bacterium]
LPIGVQGAVHDLTGLEQVKIEKRRVQNIIAEYDKLTLIEQMNKEMAHNFNNILEIILGNTELSLDECEDEKTIETLKIIFEQTMRGKDLTKNLASFAKAKRSKQKTIEISRKSDLVNDENSELSGVVLNPEKNILLTEDETAIAKLQYRVLTQAPSNHKVDIANNGQLAIDLFDKNEYNLVSLDYILPGNINGMDVYNHIRKTDKNIPIMFVSGSLEFINTINKLKHKDTNIDHIVKPCHNKDYINSMNKLLARSG